MAVNKASGCTKKEGYHSEIIQAIFDVEPEGGVML